MAETVEAAPAIERREPALGRLKALGAQTWADLVFYLPRRYKDYADVPAGFQAASGQKACLKLRVLSKTAYDRAGDKLNPYDRSARPFRLALRVADACGEEGWLSVFGNTWPWWDAVAGTDLHAFGEVSTWNGQWQLRNAERVPDEDLGRMAAVYPQKPGYLSSGAIAKGVATALRSHLDDAIALICDALVMPEPAIERLLGFDGGLRAVLAAVHEPQSRHQADRAIACIRRLAALHLVRQARAIERRPEIEASIVPVSSATVRALAGRLPFPLTGDQRRAINDIVADLRSPRPMRRLLTGDVGSGKSLCFQIPAAACQTIGKKAAILAPNLLIADQIAEEISRLFPGTPVATVTKDRKPHKTDLEANPILVGTTALLAWSAKHGHVPDLLVVDEQHKHSRRIREAVAGSHTNLIEASATPIPRSLALITHGGMEVSTIKECPVKKAIETRIVTLDEDGRLNDFIGRALEANWQVAVVYGRVEEDENTELRSIEAELGLWEQRFPGRVGVLHGRMKDDEKESVIRRMRDGKISLLVSSIVIELGLTLPSLKAMVVVNAEMFGLATLHQLRGRVARAGGRGKFLMFLPKDVREEARGRLNTMVETDDGFAIAERDMTTRGFGDLTAEAEDQTGACATLFTGVVVTPTDLQEASAVLDASRSIA